MCTNWWNTQYYKLEGQWTLFETFTAVINTKIWFPGYQTAVRFHKISEGFGLNSIDRRQRNYSLVVVTHLSGSTANQHTYSSAWVNILRFLARTVTILLVSSAMCVMSYSFICIYNRVQECQKELGFNASLGSEFPFPEKYVTSYHKYKCKYHWYKNI